MEAFISGGGEEERSRGHPPADAFDIRIAGLSKKAGFTLYGE